MMRAIFFGTPDIAVPALEALHEVATVALVICQPDRPAGRGLAPKAPAVKVRALELGLTVEQPTKVRTPDFAERLRSVNADVALVMAYGRILPTQVLQAPRLGCINLHASILPKYRGAAPITWAVVDGARTSGVSLMQMDEGMDTGPVYAVREIPIGGQATAGDLAVDLAQCAAGMVRDELLRAVAGELAARPQDESGATHARMLDKGDGRVDWSKAAQVLHDHVRGMTPWPGAFTTVKTSDGPKTLKILETRTSPGASDAPAGTVVVAHRGRIEVVCGAGRVEIVRAQLEGKKPLGAAELVGGRAISQGMVLGEGALE